MHQLLAVAAAEHRHLLEIEGWQFLAAYGLPLPRYGLVHSAAEAVTAAENIGYPVAVKIVSRDILHKSEAGGVKLNLHTGEEVAAACQDIMGRVNAYKPGARFEGLLVCEMLAPGLECIAGMSRDATFGPAIMCGLGGVFVEVLRDVSFRIPPFDKAEALAMIHELQGAALLTGARGQSAKDIDALADLLLKIALIAEENPEIQELDINPCLVYEQGLAIADVRIML